MYAPERPRERVEVEAQDALCSVWENDTVLAQGIDQHEYEICAECWSALETKLKGRGRKRKGGELVLLPPLQASR